MFPHHRTQPANEVRAEFEPYYGLDWARSWAVSGEPWPRPELICVGQPRRGRKQKITEEPQNSLGLVKEIGDQAQEHLRSINFHCCPLARMNHFLELIDLPEIRY